jgi:HPt (histidine-containing phosphotransfer) domain-containing protein
VSSADPRSRRVALVDDALLEDHLDALAADGYGLIQLPPDGLDAATVHAWLEQVAEHVEEFLRTGYEVVLVSDGRHEGALAALGLPALAQYAIQPPSTSRLTPET